MIRKEDKVRSVEYISRQGFYQVRKIEDTCAEEICKQANLPMSFQNKITSLISKNITVAKYLPGRINYVFSVLEKYGYSKEEALNMLDNNITILMHDSNELNRCLAIANRYGFDEEFLAKSVYSKLSDKELFALIEELKENGIEPTADNVNKLYITVSEKDQLDGVLKLHPLTKKDIFTYSIMYDKAMKSMNSSNSKTR